MCFVLLCRGVLQMQNILPFDLSIAYLALAFCYMFLGGALVAAAT